MKLEIEGSLTLEEIRELRKVLIWLRRKRKKQGAKFTYKLEIPSRRERLGKKLEKRRTYGKIKGFHFLEWLELKNSAYHLKYQFLSVNPYNPP